MLRNQPKFKFALLFLDIFVFFAALFIALLLSNHHRPIHPEDQVLYLQYITIVSSVCLVTYLASFYFNNLYKRNIVLTRYRQFILIIKSLLIVCAATLLFAIFFFHRELVTFGRLFFALLFSVSFALSIFYRLILINPFLKTAAIKKIAIRNLLIVGQDKTCISIVRSLTQDPYNHFHIVGLVNDSLEVDDEIKFGNESEEHIHNLGNLDNLAKIIQQHDIDEILVALDGVGYQQLIHTVEKCMDSPAIVRISSNFLKIIVEKMQVEHYSGIPVIMLSQAPLNSYMWKIKRFLDILISLFAIIALSPLFAIIALGIKLSSPGPVFFKQIRIGKDGKSFNFYKFRSMHINSDSNDHKKYVQNFIQNKNTCNDNKIQVFKITNDPRIFKLGSFLRKSSLDEFPQFFNVLKGDMSLVGPRPCLPYEWECYDDWHKNRLKILPGCTGMWQALGRSSVSFEEMVVLDLYYVSNMSVLLDLRIILLTFPVIFLGKGGY